jgi:hypothetical protein
VPHPSPHLFVCEREGWEKALKKYLIASQTKKLLLATTASITYVSNVV